jgi:Zn-dependent protease/CBS domain-containing protein
LLDPRSQAWQLHRILEMKWSFRIAKVAGTEVRIHATFFLLLIWIGASFLVSGGVVAAVSSVAFVCTLFVCVVLHEFGHVFAAKRFGIDTPDITLLPIGGLARMNRMPERPYQELIVALAGPAVNVVIAAVIFLIARPSFDSGMMAELGEPGAILPQIGIVNLWLAVFNLIPAFPMDGGRVLRAALASTMDHGRATNIAARIGQGLAIVGGMAGLVFGNPILVLIAVFIYFGAAQENAATIMRDTLDGYSVNRAMITDFVSLHPDSTTSDAIDALLAGSQHDFPVIDPSDGLLGIATRTRVIAALRQHGSRLVPITEILEPCPVTLSASASTIDALEALQSSPASMIPVIDRKDGRLVGLVTAENIGEMMMVMTALQQHPESRSCSQDPRANKPAKA